MQGALGRRAPRRRVGRGARGGYSLEGQCQRHEGFMTLRDGLRQNTRTQLPGDGEEPPEGTGGLLVPYLEPLGHRQVPLPVLQTPRGLCRGRCTGTSVSAARCPSDWGPPCRFTGDSAQPALGPWLIKKHESA